MGPADRFILSKGHAAGALYVTLWSVGLLAEEDLATFHADGTLLAGHPVPGWSGTSPSRRAVSGTVCRLRSAWRSHGT